MHWTRPQLDQLLQDARHGWRQLLRQPTTSLAAILSLSLALGACLAAFRLVDALLLRPMPIANARLTYLVAREGVGPTGDYRISESSSYPLYREMRAAVAPQAGLVAASYADRVDVTYRSDADMEKAYLQYVSGDLFPNFGLPPALGRLFTAADDQAPGASPYAVLSYDYWTRRFGQDPRILGRPVRHGLEVYQIIGVVSAGFTGTEPGTMIDVFLPMSAQPATLLANRDSFWLRPFLRPQPQQPLEPLHARLDATYRSHERERAKTFSVLSRGVKEMLAGNPGDQLILQPAATGSSSLQSDHRLSLAVLAVLVGLVLLIACANLGNLMLARSLARAREMALRLSIGASRARLIRLVLLESLWIALAAVLAGGLFAWWAAPFVVSRINPPSNPARIAMPFDWRLALFALALTVFVALLFGLLPALRVSGLAPSTVLKGGQDPHTRQRWMHALTAVQVAFCVLILFLSGLFTATYRHLTAQPLGFRPDHLLTLDTVSVRPQPPIYWSQLADHLRAIPGVDSVSYSPWALLSGSMSNNFIALHGGPPHSTLTSFLSVSPTWRHDLGLRLLSGRDLRPTDTHPGVAFVNEVFAQTYFAGQDPVGQFFEILRRDRTRARVQIIGLVANARYNDLRRATPPVAYVPFAATDSAGLPVPVARATFNVRTAANLAATLRREVTNFRSDFRVSNLRPQQELIDRHTLRERLLALLAAFFSLVALTLAAVGLYGVLDYSVLQRRREIGIRLALGASAGAIVRGVVAASVIMVTVGVAAGLALGVASETIVEKLLFGVHASNPAQLAVPAAILLTAALLAALPPTWRAIRLDPVQTLRND